jgi:hypothetical protein
MKGEQPVAVGSLEKCTLSILPPGGELGVKTLILTELSEQTLRSSGAKVTDRRSTDGCGDVGSTCTTVFVATDQRSRVRSPGLPDFLRSSGSGTGSTQPREDN